MTEVPELEFEEPIELTELVGKTGIILRESTAADIPAELAFINKHRLELEAMEPSYKNIQTENDLIMPHQNVNLRFYNIWHKGKHVGFRSRKKEDDGKVSTGCIIDEDHRRQGFGLDSLLTLAEYEFMENDAPSLITYVRKDNQASIAAMQKAGLKLIRSQGDELLFELTKGDWLKSREAETSQQE